MSTTTLEQVGPVLVSDLPPAAYQPSLVERLRAAFQVHLGGRLGEDAGFGRKERGLKVTAEGAADYVERVLTNYVDGREEGEKFAVWARRADASQLT